MLGCDCFADARSSCRGARRGERLMLYLHVRRGDRRYNMHSFHYRDGHLYREDVDLTRVATEFGTPTYVYSAGTIVDHYTRLDAALAPLDHLICYAVKANSNRAILNLLAGAGAGFDIVSGGELFRVLAAGGDPAR